MHPSDTSYVNLHVCTTDCSVTYHRERQEAWHCLHPAGVKPLLEPYGWVGHQQPLVRSVARGISYMTSFGQGMDGRQHLIRIDLQQTFVQPRDVGAE